MRKKGLALNSSTDLLFDLRQASASVCHINTT